MTTNDVSTYICFLINQKFKKKVVLMLHQKKTELNLPDVKRRTRSRKEGGAEWKEKTTGNKIAKEACKDVSNKKKNRLME